MSDYIEVTFHPVNTEQAEILIARLAVNDFDGFEETANELKAFISDEKYDPVLAEELSAEYGVSFSVKPIREENWNKVWESNFHPVIINDFALIRADFHEPVPGIPHEIIITPKMSFGTGHHATTKMMVALMSEIDFSGKSVFDFGTGTAILAILSEKLGADKIVAIDNDDWSIANAKENVEKNGCTKIRIEKADSASGQGQFDIILANIIKAVIIDNLDAMTAQLKANGILLISGLLAEDEADILKCAKKRSLIVDKKASQNGWICLRFSI